MQIFIGAILYTKLTSDYMQSKHAQAPLFFFSHFNSKCRLIKILNTQKELKLTFTDTILYIINISIKKQYIYIYIYIVLFYVFF